MTTCFGYTRVSTAKQGEGVSLEVQKEEITRYAEKHGLTISRWFEEKETAAKSGRPVFNAIMRDLNDHKADGLIVHKIDRSARNFRDWAKIGELSDRGVAIHFVTESLDFQSRGGRLTADIQAVIASDYIRNLREEAKKGLRGRFANYTGCGSCRWCRRQRATSSSFPRCCSRAPLTTSTSLTTPCAAW